MRGLSSLLSFHHRFGPNRACAVAFLSFFVFVALSCTSQESGRREEDRLEKAYALIDGGREREAIEILESSLQKGGMSAAREEEFKAALASAYIKRAGLPAQSFYDFARTWIDAEDTDNANFSFAPRGSDGSSATDPKTALEVFEAHGLQALAFILQVKSRFDRLPDLTVEQDRELEKALGVLSTIQSPSRGVALYRGLISTVRFKYRLKTGLYFIGGATAPTADSAASAASDPLACVRGKTGYLSGLEDLAEDIDSILGDLMIAFPSQNASMAGARDGVAHARQELAQLRTETLPNTKLGGFEWTEVVRFVRLQFGWEWSCR